MNYTTHKSSRDWLVPDYYIARQILRSCVGNPFALRYFSNALRNGISLDAVTSTLKFVTVKQKLAWLGSAYLEGLLIVHKKLDPDVADKVRAREQKRRNKYNSLVENVRKALEIKSAGLKYKNVWKAFNIEGMTVARRVYQLVGAYSTMTIAILVELGEIADTS